jgi:uncharacterized protein
VNSEPKVEDLLATIRKAIDKDLGDLGSGGVGSSMSSQSSGTLMRGAMREMRVNMGQDFSSDPASKEIAQLRARINKNRIAESFSQPTMPKLNTQPLLAVSAQPKTGFAGILGGDLDPREPRREPAPLPPPRKTYAAPPPPPPLNLRPSFDIEPDYQQKSLMGNDQQRWQYEDEQVFAEPDYGQQLPFAPDQYEEAHYEQTPALISPDTAAAANSAFNQLAESLMTRAMGERSVEQMTQELLRGMLKQWLDDNLPEMVERLVREEIERVARRGR